MVMVRVTLAMPTVTVCKLLIVVMVVIMTMVVSIIMGVYTLV
jgi:hypothetical protein